MAARQKKYDGRQMASPAKNNIMEVKENQQPELSNIQTSLSKWKLLGFLCNRPTHSHYIADLQMALELHVHSVKAGMRDGWVFTNQGPLQPL